MMSKKRSAVGVSLFSAVFAAVGCWWYISKKRKKKEKENENGTKENPILLATNGVPLLHNDDLHIPDPETFRLQRHDCLRQQQSSSQRADGGIAPLPSEEFTSLLRSELRKLEACHSLKEAASHSSILTWLLEVPQELEKLQYGLYYTENQVNMVWWKCRRILRLLLINGEEYQAWITKTKQKIRSSVEKRLLTSSKKSLSKLIESETEFAMQSFLSRLQMSHDTEWVKALNACHIPPCVCVELLIAGFIYTVDSHKRCSCVSLEECEKLKKSEEAEKNNEVSDKKKAKKKHVEVMPKPAFQGAHGYNPALWAVTNWSRRVMHDPNTPSQDRQRACRLLDAFAPFWQRLDDLILLLPKVRSVVFRGVPVSLARQYRVNTLVSFAPFTSTSLVGEEARAFMDPSKPGTFFLIRAHSPALIDFLSWFPEQSEALLAQYSTFRVKSKVSRAALRLLQCQFDIVTLAEEKDAATDEERVAEVIASAQQTTFIYKHYLERYVPNRILVSNYYGIGQFRDDQGVGEEGRGMSSSNSKMIRLANPNVTQSSEGGIDVLQGSPSRLLPEDSGKIDYSSLEGEEKEIVSWVVEWAKAATRGSSLASMSEKTENNLSANVGGSSGCISPGFGCGTSMYAVIIGEGGSGKTSSTLAALSALVTSGCFPVFISLPNVSNLFSRPGALDEYVLHSIGLSPIQFQLLCEKISVVILLDSLDECEEMHSDNKSALHVGLMNMNEIISHQQQIVGGKGAKIILSTRPDILKSLQISVQDILFGLNHQASSFSSSSSDALLQIWQIQSFSDQDVSEYVRRSIHNASSSSSSSSSGSDGSASPLKETEETIQKQVMAYHPEYRHSPMILSIICTILIAHDERKKKQIPLDTKHDEKDSSTDKNSNKNQEGAGEGVSTGNITKTWSLVELYRQHVENLLMEKEEQFSASAASTDSHSSFLATKLTKLCNLAIHIFIQAKSLQINVKTASHILGCENDGDELVRYPLRVEDPFNEMSSCSWLHKSIGEYLVASTVISSPPKDVNQLLTAVPPYAAVGVCKFLLYATSADVAEAAAVHLLYDCREGQSVLHYFSEQLLRQQAELATGTSSSSVQQSLPTSMSENEKNNWKKEKYIQLATTYHHLGYVYEELGQDVESKNYFEKAVELRKLHLGPTHPLVADSLNGLACAYRALGKAEKKKELLEQCLRIFEENYGADSEKLVSTLGNLGWVNLDFGNVDEAKKLFERSIVISEKADGKNQLTLVGRLMGLASAESESGDRKMAKGILERALAINEIHLGSDHHSLGSILNNLAIECGELGDLERKKTLLERALILQEKHYGSEHPKVASALCNIANAYGDFGNMKKKKEFLEKAIEIFERNYGSESILLKEMLSNLAIVHFHLENYSLHKELLERVLRMSERHYGKDHYLIAPTLGNLSNSYHMLGDFTKQLELLERALQLKEAHFGPNHFEVGLTLHKIGLLDRSQGNLLGSKETLERTLSIFEKHYSQASYAPEIPRLLTTLADVFGQLGDFEKKKELAEKANLLREKQFGPDHFELVWGLGILAEAYFDLSEVDKGTALRHRILSLYEKEHGTESFELTKPLADLADAYANAYENCEAKTISFLERMLQLQEVHFGSNHPAIAVTCNNIGLLYLNLQQQSEKESENSKEVAKQFLERSVAIEEAQSEPNIINLVCYWEALANCYSTLGNFKGSQDMLEKVLRLKESNNEEGVALINILQKLGANCRLQGKLEQQVKYLDAAVENAEKHFLPNDTQFGAMMFTIATTYSDDDKKCLQRSSRLLQRALELFLTVLPADHPSIWKISALLNRNMQLQSPPSQSGLSPSGVPTVSKGKACSWGHAFQPVQKSDATSGETSKEVQNESSSKKLHYQRCYGCGLVVFLDKQGTEAEGRKTSRQEGGKNESEEDEEVGIKNKLQSEEHEAKGVVESNDDDGEHEGDDGVEGWMRCCGGGQQKEDSSSAPFCPVYLCKKCWEVGKKHAMYHQQAHLMGYSSQRDNYCCDECEKNSTIADSMFCQACDYDVCFQCLGIEKGEQEQSSV